ncbi:hypothetical protein E2C01_054279 [Portunus trituberculatus]|uniref:RNA-directed DNA polymerase from mobile element jockey n=1 Tax=Portunus trituberculatus TaxID=210409 RepID=A0A5B7GIX1_PORTR|nr:hypothetical protein [Portunus trituberculatus]
MQFDFSTNPIPAPALTLGASTLNLFFSTKLLGVIVGNKLSWHAHIKNVTLYAAAAQIPRVPAHELTSIFKILPKLIYASPVWSSCLTAIQLNRLKKTQKRAIKIILGSTNTTYNVTLATLHLTTFADHYAATLGQFGSKLLNQPRHRDLLSL